MDWIYGIQKALDYVETHLTEEIDYGEVAKQAYSSSFHFQRVFSILCGYTLGDYIRMRRLTLAAEELIRTDEKIIDIALKYGYNTPESFTRAFSAFHGITPTQARHGENIRSFSKLSVKLILSGGNTMNYRIEKKDAFKIVCRRKQITKPQGDIATEAISSFWNECTSDGSIEKLCGYIPENGQIGGLLGICFSKDMADSGFPYGIGAEYNGKPVDNSAFEIIEIPAYTYAVFTCKGPMPDAFKKTYQSICTEFFPQSSYEYGYGVELEVYPSANVTDPNYTCEIWIAVNEKEKK